MQRIIDFCDLIALKKIDSLNIRNNVQTIHLINRTVFVRHFSTVVSPVHLMYKNGRLMQSEQSICALNSIGIGFVNKYLEYR